MATAGVEMRAAPGSATAGGPASIGVLLWDDRVGPMPLGFGPDAEPIVLDWAGRGPHDLLVTARVGPAGRRARVYSPVPDLGDGGFVYDEGRDVPALDGLRLPCPIPNGKPSRFDLVAMAAEGLVLLENVGGSDEPRFGDRALLDLPGDLGLGTGRVVQMLPVDWDGDGLDDLVVGFDDLADYWPDPDVPPHQQIGLTDAGGHPCFDDAGRWLGRMPTGRLLWLRNVGSPGSPRFEVPRPLDAEGPLEGLGPRPAALLAPWGPSRSPELMTTDAGGVILLYRNFGGQLPPVPMDSRPILDDGGSPLTLPDDRTVVAAGDIDRDRRSELVFGTADGRIFAVHSGRGRDSGRIVGPVRQEGRTLRLGGGAVLSAGDLDGDGGIDLVSGDATGRLTWLPDLGEPGDHRFGDPEVIESGGEVFRYDPGVDGRLLGPSEPPLGYACPLVVDWKNNGRPDLLVCGAGGEVRFLRNNGHATQPRFDVAEPLLGDGRQPIILPHRTRPAAADWNGSGLPDLLAPDLQGILCVWPRTETLGIGPPEPLVDRNGRFIRLDGAFGLGGGGCLWAGPWTGSGRPDLLVGLPISSRFVVPAMTGEPLTALDDLPNVVLLENLGDGVVHPRPLRTADGHALVVTADSCSPIGVDWSGAGTLDLLIGADDGSVRHVPREHLRW